jgi:hypothetical protein
MKTKRTQATTVDDLLIDPVGAAERELRSLFAARPMQRQNGMDAMSARVMAASKPIPARSGFDRRGTDKWLESMPRT